MSGCPRGTKLVAPHARPAWQTVHSILLSLDYSFRRDLMSVTEGQNLDYPLNIAGTDTGIYINRIAGFAGAFIFSDKPTAELYRLFGDSDLYKWQKSTKLTPSDPAYSIYTKDGREHIRQDYTIAVTPKSKLPDYFPAGLKNEVESGKLALIACGNFYFISAEDIYTVHFVAPAPLSKETDAMLKDMVERMKFSMGEPEVNKDEGKAKEAAPEKEGEGHRLYSNPNGDSAPGGDGGNGGQGGNGGGGIPRLPGPGG